MRLYVDVDDTLVLWTKDGAVINGPLPMGAGADDWKPNTRLILEIERWVEEHPKDRLIVWSGGGEMYAAQWGQRLLHHLPHTPMHKDYRLLLEGDIYIDDMELGGNATRGFPLTWTHKVEQLA